MPATPSTPKYRHRSGGFALIAVLGLLMLLSLVAAFISGYAEQRLEQTYQLQRQLQGQLDRDATMATLLHVVATRPLMQNAILLRNPQQEARSSFDPFADSFAGVKVEDYPHLLVEGTRYRGIGGSAFSLQDEGPLLSLLEPDRQRWTRFFAQHGLSPQQAERFLDQLQDYTDRDDVRRLNGATSADYLNQGLQVPPQRLMISPGQVFNLLDAAALRPQLQAMLPYVTARSGQLNNLNTAPAAVLQSLPGFDAALAEAIVSERRQRPYADLSDANARLGRIIPLDPLTTPSRASPFMRIQLWSETADCRQPLWLGLSSTPTSRTAPWEIDYLFSSEYEQPCDTPQSVDFPPLDEPAMDG
ncbi:MULTISPECIES: type II secretion system minor pseudopilin [Pseudomonadaceae]|uniref:general secretion pathway protein GspK n=1 Tax=Pseudomonadaceae TaxID=135621 RepID=UPI000F77D165|nr:type II secretion system protein GspK [Pseudomonas sp. o96-267]RRV43162.1 hypothetical protein EGJ86_00835 [Pseudomonas sp. o96-267]